MIKRLLFLLITMVLATVATAQNYTISGTVRAASSSETLISATVYDMLSGKGALTNAQGRYSLTLPEGKVVLRVSYVGYETIFDTFQLDGNKMKNYDMVSNTVLHTVTVTADRISSHRSSQMSAIDIPLENIKSVPVLFGETDVLKALQLLPGVQSGTEGMSGIYVRGGGPDQNLFLLDGVPLYNVNHLGGFFSAFNADAIKNVTLYKGSFPARFGGRLSSVLDITTNDGNDKKLHGDVSVGLIAAKLNLEGPLYKDKTTFNVSVRRTYADLLMQPFLYLAKSIGEDIDKLRLGYYFYDLNAKVTHRFSDRSRLIGSFYSGDDKIYAKMKYNFGGDYEESLKLGYNWGNLVGSLRWNYELTPKLFMNLTGAFTRYRNDISVAMEDIEYYANNFTYTTYEMYYKSGIRDFMAKADFDYQPSPDHTVKFGGAVTHHIFQPDVTGSRIETNESGSDFVYDTVVGQSIVHANEMTAFVEDDWTISETVKINAGLNITGFAVQDEFYPSIQPRLSGRIMLSDDLSFKAGYSYMTQYMHQLSNSSISLPTDLWVPVTARIAPMYAHQVAAGLFYTWSGIADFSVEGYYKKMSNMLEYKDGASFFGTSVGWEDKVCMGDGWSYGVEFLAQRTVGKLTGWVGYTWSRTMRLFDREGQVLNNGEPFPAKYDRRHDISIVASYKPNKNFDASATWVFSSGNTGTLPMQEFVDPETGQTISYVENRNNFRMPAYHRMDVGVNFHKDKRHGRRTISLSVYNLYNNKNPFLVYKKDGTHYVVNGHHYGSALVQLSIFPIIPSLSYSFKF